MICKQTLYMHIHEVKTCMNIHGRQNMLLHIHDRQIFTSMHINKKNKINCKTVN